MKTGFLIFSSIALLCALAHPSAADTPLVRVGERVITLEEIQKTVRSMPFGGSVDDRRLMGEALDETINAQLLYMEAVKSGVTESPEYGRAAREFRESALADLYREELLKREAKVDETAVKALADEKGITRKAARALIATGLREAAVQKETSRLFDEYHVHFSPMIAEKEMDKFQDGDILVNSTAFRILHGDIKDAFSRFGGGREGLLELLSQKVEIKLFSAEAEKRGLAANENFKMAAAEYERSLAANLYREKFFRENAPGKKAVEEYLDADPHFLYHPRTAEALMIVTGTEEEARRVRERAMAGENFFELAMENSIAPDAKANAGRIGPIRIGDGPYSAVDAALLKIKPGEISEPVKGAKGYSVFKLLGITGAVPRAEDEARQLARDAILEDRLHERLKELRSSGAVEILNAAPAAAQ